jgi:hypothetical protein
MFSEKVSEEICFKHEQANHFCLAVLEQIHLTPYILNNIINIDYNNNIPGLIIIFKEEIIDSMYYEIRKLYRDKNLINYFNWKRFNKSIHINLKKEYINKLEELETLFRIQHIF